jgi:hypothetical protein
LSPIKGKDLPHWFLLHLHHLHLLLRMWQDHLTSWKKSKHPHLLHLPSKFKIGAPRFLATIPITTVKHHTHSSSVSNHRLGVYLSKLSFALDS